MAHRSIGQLFAVAGLALGLGCGLCNAQVAPPPPPTPVPEPAAPAKPDTPEARPQPQAPRPGNTTASRLSDLPTNIPYPKLAQRDEDGMVIRLKALPDILALRSNPTVGDQSVEEIMPVIYGRRARFEMLLIENLDLYWALTGGEIENLDMSNLKDMSRVAEMIKPLVGKTTLSEELINRGILTRVQGGMNEHIVREYKQAISDEIQALGGGDGLTEFMRFILQDSIHEAKLAYLAMMAESMGQTAELLEETGLESKALMGASGKLAEDNIQAEREIHEYDAALRTLSVDDAIKFLTALREGRPNPNIAPTIQRLVVTHDRKKNYEGDMGFKRTAGDNQPMNTQPGKPKPEGNDKPGKPAPEDS